MGFKQNTKTVTTASAELVEQNANRSGLLIINRGSATVYLKFTEAHSGTEGIELPSGSYYEPYDPPTGAVYAVSASGSQSVYFTETTR